MNTENLLKDTPFNNPFNIDTWRRGKILEVIDDLTYVILLDLGFSNYQLITGKLHGFDEVDHHVISGILFPNREIKVKVLDEYTQEDVFDIYILFLDAGGVVINLAKFLAVNAWGKPNEDFQFFVREDESDKDLHIRGSVFSEVDTPKIRVKGNVC